MVELTPSEKRNLIEALRDDYSVRQISETLGFNRNLLYYQPKIDPSEEVLRTEIEQLAARYPTYGYRRITKLLVRMGCPVGYRRVARLMKSANLSVSVKRICQTIASGGASLGQPPLRCAIRSGLAISLMFDSRDTLSMFVCSWMSSLAS